MGRPPKTDRGKVDDEGTPDVYRNLIDKLKQAGTVDEPIEETMSMDWRAERQLIPELMKRLSEQPGWVPRIAELVLFVRTIGPDEEICFDGGDGGSMRYRIYDSKERKFTGFPSWEAGVVGQVASEKVQLRDLVQETEKQYQVNYSGLSDRRLSRSERGGQVHLEEVQVRSLAPRQAVCALAARVGWVAGEVVGSDD